MEKISHLICGKPLWQARQTFLTKHKRIHQSEDIESDHRLLGIPEGTVSSRLATAHR